MVSEKQMSRPAISAMRCAQQEPVAGSMATGNVSGAQEQQSSWEPLVAERMHPFGAVPAAANAWLMDGGVTFHHKLRGMGQCM